MSKPRNSLLVWVSTYGETEVPKEITAGIRFSRQGAPDRRSPKKAVNFWKFITAAEKELKRKYLDG